MTRNETIITVAAVISTLIVAYYCLPTDSIMGFVYRPPTMLQSSENREYEMRFKSIVAQILEQCRVAQYKLIAGATRDDLKFERNNLIETLLQFNLSVHQYYSDQSIEILVKTYGDIRLFAIEKDCATLVCSIEQKRQNRARLLKVVMPDGKTYVV